MDNFTWHKESETTIWCAVNDWDYHKFACLMKDGTLTMFTGMNDENIEGEISTFIEHIDDKYNTDDIVMWIEIPINN